MKLFLLSQDARYGYDTYDSCIVCAESAEEAVYMTPDGIPFEQEGNYTRSKHWGYTIEDIECKEIGEADPSLRKGVILASFHGG
jgi:hypothetical protein